MDKRWAVQKILIAEVNEMADILVANAGRYGFVLLKYYMPTHGFE